MLLKRNFVQSEEQDYGSHRMGESVTEQFDCCHFDLQNKVLSDNKGQSSYFTFLLTTSTKSKQSLY